MATLPGIFTGASRKMRSSCDRCHSQKLKCARVVGRESCERCIRLRTSCRLSARATRPLRKSTRSRDSYQEQALLVASAVTHVPTTYTQSVNIEASIASPRFASSIEACMNENAVATPFPAHHFFGNVLKGSTSNSNHTGRLAGSSGPMVILDPICNSDNMCASMLYQNQATTVRSDDTPTLDLLDASFESGSCSMVNTKRMSEKSLEIWLESLNVALHECATKLPDGGRTKSAPFDRDGLDKSTHGSRKAVRFVVDELFRITASFLAVIENVFAEDHGARHDSSSTGVIDEDAAASIYICGQPQYPGLTQSPPALHVTESTPNISSDTNETILSMIVSCHSRLTEIYTSLFRKMQTCIGNQKSSPTMSTMDSSNDWGVVLPELKMGSITTCPAVCVTRDTPISSVTAASMYMGMITLLSLQFWDRTAAVVERQREISTTVSRSDLASMVWDSMASRTDQLLRLITTTKNLL